MPVAQKVAVFTLLMLILVSCEKHKPLSAAEQYFADKMLTEKQSGNFADTSDFGYIRIGKFLNNKRQNAVVIQRDTVSVLSVYELKDEEWVKIFSQKNPEHLRPDYVYITDYNFDGVNDIGVLGSVSNGTAIMSFHLWLNKGDTFKYVPEFSDIGNPILLPKHKTIQGYSACCVFESMDISNFKWVNDSLVKTSEFAIENYPYGKSVTLKKDESETKLSPFSQNEINAIVKHYAENWKLVDTSTVNRFYK